MDKNAIRKYAVWARRELISRVTQRAVIYGITEKGNNDRNADSIEGRLLSRAEKKERQALIDRIQSRGYEEVMEEAAYTWFNRFSALRFMEVNGYLPSHVRVFTDDENHFQPQILTEAINLELEGLDMEKVFDLKNANQNEELFKYLIITQCNALNECLPGMFQKIEDYTELLFPENLLREGSVVEQMIAMIPEEDWQDQVQIIGWLYQYYNSEKKDEVFAALKKNVKITKENIPAATQLFTPDWIVKYMTENSLGRLWVEGHPNDELKSQWKYYLEEAEQEPEVQVQLAEIRREYSALTPEEIKCIDPCCGSGHILCYMFDVLMQIYEASGYTTRDAVKSIVQNNIYGLDIDDRAAQLAYFSVMMKARQYDSRFFRRGVQPNVYAIAESNDADRNAVEYFCNGDAKLRRAVKTILAEMKDAKEYGSILNVTEQDWDAIDARMEEVREEISIYGTMVLDMAPMMKVAEMLSRKYEVVITNPPYMGSSGMSKRLSDFVKKNYTDTKSDMSTVMMEKGMNLCNSTGFMTMINIPVWMFLSSYEKLRGHLLTENTLVNMVHPGRGIFGSDFGTTTFVFNKTYIKGYKGHYRRLFEKQGDVETIDIREQKFLDGQGRFLASQDNYFKIPGCPIAYWVSQNFVDTFKKGIFLRDFAEPKAGLATGDNDRFERYWFEVSFPQISFDTLSVEATRSNGFKWYPCNSGGEFRKWSFNNELIVNWEHDGYEIKHFLNKNGKLAARPQNTDFYFKEGLTWNKLSSSRFAVKYKAGGSIYDDTSRSLFVDDKKKLYYLLGFMCSCVTFNYFTILNPSMSFTNGDIARLPFIYLESKKTQIDRLVLNNILISKKDWDSFEVSWNFQRHPLLQLVSKNGKMSHISEKVKLEESYLCWEKECTNRFQQLNANEEELNRIFIEIYGLQNELRPEVEEKDITVRKAILQRDIKSLISYAVGCMFGRYSLDVEGLAYAGGEWDASKYKTFLPDKDAILPICDDEYFEDDIVGRFVEFIRVVYGDATLETNLKFIADALGGKGQPREVIRNYFLNDFYADHLKIYQKRPIYWLFDSGKKGGFKCLIYMHRYQPDTIARIRTDYVHEQQSRYRTAIADLENRIAGAATGERVKLSKKLKKLQDQDAELRTYEEKIHHLADQMISIDLDDGVKVNYAKFQDVLAKIK